MEKPEFERFFIGRPAEEMPRIAPNICGIAPSAHHMAATRALDDLFGVEPPPTAQLIRELAYNAFLIEDYLHFFLLSALEFLAWPGAGLKQSSIPGSLGRVEKEISFNAIEVRKRNRRIVSHVFGRASHPEGGLPGGVSRGISEQDRPWIRETAANSLEFARYALKRFKDAILSDPVCLDRSLNEAFSLKTYDLAMVDRRNRIDFYGGRIRIVDPEGKEFARFDPGDYEKYIAEWVEPRTGVHIMHLGPLGWKGLGEGDATSLYRVGPLARLNAALAMQTPLAQEEAEFMFEALGGKPFHQTLATPWARLICLLQVAERNVAIAAKRQLTGKDIRNMALKLKRRGVGAVEAPRGTLIHDYVTDERGIIRKVNILSACRNNVGPICLLAKNVAREYVSGEDVRDGFLERIDAAIREYDPWLPYANHFLPGKMPFAVIIRNPEGDIVREIRQA